jgi:hypothetical protein
MSHKCLAPSFLPVLEVAQNHTKSNPVLKNQDRIDSGLFALGIALTCYEVVNVLLTTFNIFEDSDYIVILVVIFGLRLVFFFFSQHWGLNSGLCAC